MNSQNFPVIISTFCIHQVCHFLYWSVCLHNILKSFEQILRKFLEGFNDRQRTSNLLNFDRCPDVAIRVWGEKFLVAVHTLPYLTFGADAIH